MGVDLGQITVRCSSVVYAWQLTKERLVMELFGNQDFG